MAAWKSATGKVSYHFVNSRSAEGQAKRTSVFFFKSRGMFECAALRGGCDSHGYDRKIKDGFRAPTAAATKPISSTAPSRTVTEAVESEEATWLSTPSKLGS